MKKANLESELLALKEKLEISTRNYLLMRNELEAARTEQTSTGRLIESQKKAIDQLSAQLNRQEGRYEILSRIVDRLIPSKGSPDADLPQLPRTKSLIDEEGRW